MKPLRIFRSQGNCGCTGSASLSQTLTNQGACADPAAGASALICDPKYYSLGLITKVRLLGVPLGGNCQQFLKSANLDPRGFVFMGADGQAYVENAPKLRLPILNPAVSSAYPATGSFQFLMLGTGGDPDAWMFMAAPTAGQYVLTTAGGQWQLTDSTSTSGNTAVCTSNATTAKGNIVCCIDTGETDSFGNVIYALRKLLPAHQRVVVGDIDGDGVAGFKELPVDEYLLHPLAAFDAVQVGTYEQIGDTETQVIEGNGLPLQDAEDGAITTELACYSGDTHKFYRLPARTAEELTVDGDQAVADNGTFVTMGTHAKFTAVQFNFANFFISSVIRLSNDAANYAAIDFGLFIDGNLVHTWDVKGAKDNTLTYIHKALTPGAHDVDIRFKQTAAGGDTVVKYTSTQIFSLI